jgi:hypothetical protein
VDYKNCVISNIVTTLYLRCTRARMKNFYRESSSDKRTFFLWLPSFVRSQEGARSL